MTVGELISILKTLPPAAKVKSWSAYDDRETEEVYVSVADDGSVFILEAVIGNEVLLKDVPQA